VRIEEAIKRIERQLTPTQRLEQERYPWSYERYEYMASGKLTFRIDEWLEGMSKSWSDGKRQKLQDCLKEIVLGLIEDSEKKKEEEIKKQEMEREWREHERLRIERGQRIFRENELLEKLEREVEVWHSSQRIALTH
jgi:hypothetical protein